MEELPMANILQQYFPLIRTRKEVLKDIREDRKLLKIYQSWEREQQEEFLDFCTGQRSACYSADMLLRQYKRIRSRKKKRGKKGYGLLYKEIQKVYTIVLYENSPEEFHRFPNEYIHRFSQKSDTGIEMELLMNYIFIPLDIFKDILHNKGINNKLEAWLTFFSVDDPVYIERLIRAYPQFKDYYQEIYTLCQNTEKVMDMFSRELREMDRNTVKYMIDELNDKLVDRDRKIKSRDTEIKNQKKLLKQKDTVIAEKEAALAALEKELEELKAQKAQNT